MKNQVVLITGASSGIGKETARLLSQRGYKVYGAARRTDKMKELEQFGVKLLEMDVTDDDSMTAGIPSIIKNEGRIDVLVNNAGLALGRDSFQDASVEDWDTMFDTNVKGLAYVTKTIIPNMMERKQGHIFNIGSTAAKEVYPNGNGYCASKHAVDALSKSMRIDLLPYRIKVTGIHPGAADTEFSQVRFKGDEEKAKSVYVGFTPLYAQDVADIVYYCASLPQHVCINDLVVTCTSQANNFNFYKEI